MKNGERFRLTRSAMAIALRGGRHTAIMVPEGAIIELMNGPFDGTRLMDVRYEGEIIMMFTDDMESHTVALIGQEEEPMVCKTHKELANQWHASSAAFSVAVKTLTNKDVGKIPKESYEARRSEVEKKRLASENARLAYLLHCKEHGC